jgi:hypothetical protein
MYLLIAAACSHPRVAQEQSARLLAHEDKSFFAIRFDAYRSRCEICADALYVNAMRIVSRAADYEPGRSGTPIRDMDSMAAYFSLRIVNPQGAVQILLRRPGGYMTKRYIVESDVP